MKKDSTGGLVIIFFVCIIAFTFGAIFGTAHIGEEISKEVLPTSITRSSDILQVIDEKSFIAENITVKYQTKTQVKNVTKTYNNTTTNTTRNYTSQNNNNNNYSHNNNNYKYNTS